jgi:hypothetical protein
MSRTAIASTAPLVVDEITLDGKRVQVQSVDLSLEHVILDPQNPRIANTVAASLSEKGEALQNKLAALLWDDSDVRDLYRQVLVNKGLIERIIVRPEGTVVEGNCRTVVYRKLREKFPQERRWRHIPARVLPKDIDERDVAILLGEMHVAGKNTWTPFEKAGHVYRLHEEFSLTQEEIAQRLRMSKSKVNQLIRAFDVMKNKYLRRFPGPGSARKFSYFEELYKKPQLRDWVTTTSGAEDLFVEWVGTEKLDQGVHVRELPAILEDEEAIKALSEEGFAAAQKVIEEDNPAFTSKLFRRMVDMTEALKKAQLDDIQKVRKGGHSKARRIVQDLDKSLGHFVELCGLER